MKLYDRTPQIIKSLPSLKINSIPIKSQRNLILNKISSEDPLTPSGVPKSLSTELSGIKDYSSVKTNSISPNWKKLPSTRPGVDIPKSLLERLMKDSSVKGDINYNGKLMDKFRFKKGQFYLSHGMKRLGEYYIKKSQNDAPDKDSSISVIDESVPESVTKDNLLVIFPTINMMANPSQNERKALNLFQFNKVYYQDHFDINESCLDTLKAIWFFGHGLKNYDKLEIFTKDGSYNMDNFFNDNPNIHDIDFIFDVCYSSAILLDYNFMNEVNKRNIRLYTCGFNKELNTQNGSFLTFCLDLIQRLINKNVFLLTVKQINCWFEIISDITGMRMYCYGKDDSDINPSKQDKQVAADLIFNLIRYYFSNTGLKITLPFYANLDHLPSRQDLKETVFC